MPLGPFRKGDVSLEVVQSSRKWAGLFIGVGEVWSLGDRYQG